MTVVVALAGVTALIALPVGVMAAGHSGSRLEPVRAAYAKVADTSGSTSPDNPDNSDNPVKAVESNADGSTLAAKVAHDAKLRRTLLALRAQVAASKSAAAKGHSPAPSARSVVVGGSVADIPAVALTAYRQAAQRQNVVDPGCHVSWSLLAGIGRVESSHGQYGGSQPDASGVVHPAILGPVLDGSGGNAAIPDTDGGRYDENTQWDRAVGPMQFIPSSWATSGRDGDGDGVRDPENLFDAALAAANYLCASGGDLSTASAAERAILSYNHSWDYVLVVRGYAAAYAGQPLPAVTANVAKHLIVVPRRTTGLSTKKVAKQTPVARSTPTKRAATASPNNAPTNTAPKNNVPTNTAPTNTAPPKQGPPTTAPILTPTKTTSPEPTLPPASASPTQTASPTPSPTQS